MGKLFDFLIIGILVFAILMLLTGNDDKLMGLFSGKNQSVYDHYEKEPFNRATLIFCVIMLANEIMLLLVGPTIPALSLVSVGITIAAFGGFIVYIRKYRK